MNIYEFITPSDPITFIAKNDNIALAVAIIVGKGKADCTRKDDQEGEVSIPSLLFMAAEPMQVLSDFLGEDFQGFVKKNRLEISESLKTFAYGSIADRKTYDDAIAAITDPEKLKNFKAKHEDRNRTSTSEWVKYAWELSEKINLVPDEG